MALQVAYRYPHFKREFMDEMTLREGPKPGESMPEFDLFTLDQRRIRKQDFLNRRPVLFTLGSITCPMTTSSNLVLKKLYKELGDRVEFVTVYVREAHPGERHPQASTMDEKIRSARDLQERDQIPWTIAVDNLEGDFHRKLGSYPNAAYIMNTHGDVSYRSLWSNSERDLREGLEPIAAGRPETIGERSTRIIPILAGMGVMTETLESSGESAKRDFRQEAAPMYFLGRIASVFQPLPPLGRGIAALVTGVVAVLGLSWAMTNGISRLSHASRRNSERA